LRKLLRIQLEAFEKTNWGISQLLQGCDPNPPSIHGIGNGCYEKKFHKRSEPNPKILSTFQDTQKDNWGYGATLVESLKMSGNLSPVFQVFEAGQFAEAKSLFLELVKAALKFQKSIPFIC